MAPLVFLLCAVTSAACAVLLLRGWSQSRASLLFWSALAFVCFTVNNVMLVVDELVLRDSDLGWTRDVSGFAAVAVLLFGLIWRDQRS